MQGSFIQRHRKLFAGIFGSLLIFVLLFSAFYVAFEADHDCCGDDCEICECISMCADTLHRALDYRAAHPAVPFPVIYIIAAAAAVSETVLHDTPVSSKVRLNN